MDTYHMSIAHFPTLESHDYDLHSPNGPDEHVNRKRGKERRGEKPVSDMGTTPSE